MVDPPLPLPHNRGAGYWGELSMRQSRPHAPWCSTHPGRARAFFEALTADNLDVGRPVLVELIFKCGQRRGAKAAGEFKTEIATYGTHPARF